MKSEKVQRDADRGNRQTLDRRGQIRYQQQEHRADRCTHLLHPLAAQPVAARDRTTSVRQTVGTPAPCLDEWDAVALRPEPSWDPFSSSTAR